MTDKPLKSLNGKKFTGALAEPIDTGVIIPLNRKDLWPEFLERRHAELRRQRMAKIPDLARHLGIKFDHLDLENHSDLLSLYGSITENLATLLIRGFQEKQAGRWPDELVMQILVAIEKGKQLGTFASDKDGCKEILKQLEPKLGRPGNRTELDHKVRSLENRVSKLRAKLKREHAAKKPVHKKPRLRIVK